MSCTTKTRPSLPRIMWTWLYCCSMTAATNSCLNQLRRELLKGSMQWKYHSLCNKAPAGPTKLLLGDNLTERVKAANAMSSLMTMWPWHVGLTTVQPLQPRASLWWVPHSLPHGSHSFLWNSQYRFGPHNHGSLCYRKLYVLSQWSLILRLMNCFYITGR